MIQQPSSNDSTSKLAIRLASGVANKYNSVNSVPSTVKTIDPASIGLDVSKLPDEYKDVFNAIPSLTYRDTRSGLMKFSDALGITNYLQKLQGDAETQARSDYMQLLSNAREEGHNSPAEQAARMRAAGFNPDLAGGVSADQAAEFNEPEQRYEYPGVGLADVASFIGSIPEAITNAMSMYSAYQGIKSQGIDLVNKEIGSAGSNYEGLFKFLMSTLTRDDYDSILQGGFTSAFKEDTLDRLGITSRKARRVVGASIELAGNSFRRMLETYKSYDDFDKTRESFLRRRSMPFFSDNDNFMGESLKEVSEYLWKAEKAEAKLRYYLAFRQQKFNMTRSGTGEALALNSKDSYDQRYYNRLDPGMQAFAQNTMSSYESSYYQSLNGSKMASFDFALKEYEKSMATYRKNLIDGLLKKGDAYSNLLAFQLISGVNPASDFISNVTKLAPTLGISK